MKLCILGPVEVMDEEYKTQFFYLRWFLTTSNKNSSKQK